jgi:hypothetical protein
MFCNLREGCADFITVYFVTFDRYFERIGTGIDQDVIFLIADQEAQRVQRKFKLRRNANEASTDKFLHTVPTELKR